MSVTKAEKEALRAIRQHGTVKGAAASLGKSKYTVEQQLKTARERLGVTTTIEAVDRVWPIPE